MPTTLKRAHVFAALFSAALGAAGLSACVDSLHLDPAGTGGSTSATTGSGAGGCHSNPDCAFPKPVCDTARHACVGCLTVSDCAYAPGTVCSKGVCECPDGGACGKAASGTGGSGAGGQGTGGTGGSGAGGGSADAGNDSGPDDAGSDAPACMPTCSDALTMGGTVCAGTISPLVYKQLQTCAGCNTSATCTLSCKATFCADLPIDAKCKACLSSFCAAPLSACSAH